MQVEQLKKKGKGKQPAAKADKPKDAPAAIQEGKGAAAGESKTDDAADGDAAEGSVVAEEDKPTAEDAAEESKPPSKPAHGRQPSMSVQSRMRSTSFRKSSGAYVPTSPTSAGTGKGPALPALSPGGDSVTEIYRKQASRLEELERENKRFARELEAAEERWHRSEEELEELREGNLQVAELRARAGRADAKDGETTKLVGTPPRTQPKPSTLTPAQKSELVALQRQNAHLQSTAHRSHRRSTSPGQLSPQDASAADLQAQLDSKASTIESMELEISNLRAQVAATETSRSSHTEQVGALQEKLERAERAAGSAQRELLDVRRSLDRLSEKAVTEGTARTSAETALKAAVREAEDASRKCDEAARRAENLEKKLATLTTLHREADARRRDGERGRDSAEKEVMVLRKRMDGLGRENQRMKEERERARAREGRGGGQDDDAMDDLEDEERRRLEKRVRELEGELFEARRGAWADRRRELAEGADEDVVGASAGGFDEVDLTADGTQSARRQSARQSRSGGASGGFAKALSSGLGAFTGAAGPAEQRLGLLEDDEDFDESAFAQAREEEARKRIERVKELKRGLKEWEGYRLDIVDVRMNGGGLGEIFEV